MPATQAPETTRWCQARYCAAQLRGGFFCERHARLLGADLAAAVARIEGTAGSVLGAVPSPEALERLEALAEAVELCAIDERVSVVNLFRLRASAVRDWLHRLGHRGPCQSAETEEARPRAEARIQATLLPDGGGRDWGPYAHERGGAR